MQAYISDNTIRLQHFVDAMNSDVVTATAYMVDTPYRNFPDHLFVNAPFPEELLLNLPGQSLDQARTMSFIELFFFLDLQGRRDLAAPINKAILEETVMEKAFKFPTGEAKIALTAMLTERATTHVRTKSMIPTDELFRRLAAGRSPKPRPSL